MAEALRTATPAVALRRLPSATMPSLQSSGKSTIAFQLSLRPDKPHVIFVELAGCASFDHAARRVAEAVGFPLHPTAAELLAIRRSGERLDCRDEWGWEQYSSMLQLFVRACRELHAEGRLRAPVSLIIDEATRPFQGYLFRGATPVDAPSGNYPVSAAVYTPANRTLMDATVAAVSYETNYRPSAHYLRVVAIASRIDRHESWMGECGVGMHGCS